jgi:UDPglucose--hexose-1-phosphate uridylyltransferase
VIIAEDRALRPSDYQVASDPHNEVTNCPFCPGKEHLTPPEIRAVRDGGRPNDSNWNVRVIPNKYAALRVEGVLSRRAAGIYDEMNGIGAHEVVIETPNHHARMHEYTEAQMESLLRVCHERVVDLSRDLRMRHVQLFRNHGPGSGASLSHPHTQIIALPMVPSWVKRELICAKEHWDRTERCLFADIVDQERRDGDRMVCENDRFIAFEPFASKFPFETWIVPKEQRADVREVNRSDLAALAQIMRDSLRALAIALNDPPYNLMLFSAPFSAHDAELVANTAADYRWHIEIIPRLTIPGGFEWATGCHINPTPPEAAGEYLRKALMGAR